MKIRQNSLFMDIAGFELTNEDQALLMHPAIGGLVLFARNYASRAQLQNLIHTIRAIRPDLIIAADHEGGRVQRFREEFTRIPPMLSFGVLYDQNLEEAKHAVFDTAKLIALELGSVGIDLNLSPVLDLNYGHNTVIGDRAFHSDPEVVAALGLCFMQGLQSGGMQAVAKHFPGHGFVSADSHLALPVDSRELDAILARDVEPFKILIAHGLAAIMPAHIVYEKCDAETANFSKFWLKKILKERLGFHGLVISDDMHMQGAAGAGDMIKRVEKAQNAGCDCILICNDRAGLISVLDQQLSEDVLDLQALKGLYSTRD